jgi:hypothetical protein
VSSCLRLCKILVLETYNKAIWLSVWSTNQNCCLQQK